MVTEKVFEKLETTLVWIEQRALDLTRSVPGEVQLCCATTLVSMISPKSQQLNPAAGKSQVVITGLHT
jgi:hypothetical protein